MKPYKNMEFNFDEKGIPVSVNVNFSHEDLENMFRELLRKNDYEPVVHAHWEDITKINCKYAKEYRCSKCGRTVAVIPMQYDKGVTTIYPYCHCGAKMDEENWVAEYDESGSICGSRMDEEVNND